MQVIQVSIILVTSQNRVPSASNFKKQNGLVN